MARSTSAHSWSTSTPTPSAPRRPRGSARHCRTRREIFSRTAAAGSDPFDEVEDLLGGGAGVADQRAVTVIGDLLEPSVRHRIHDLAAPRHRCEGIMLAPHD